jgi:hypothetical protein
MLGIDRSNVGIYGTTVLDKRGKSEVIFTFSEVVPATAVDACGFSVSCESLLPYYSLSIVFANSPLVAMSSWKVPVPPNVNHELEGYRYSIDIVTTRIDSREGKRVHLVESRLFSSYETYLSQPSTSSVSAR